MMKCTNGQRFRPNGQRFWGSDASEGVPKQWNSVFFQDKKSAEFPHTMTDRQCHIVGRKKLQAGQGPANHFAAVTANGAGPLVLPGAGCGSSSMPAVVAADGVAVVEVAVVAMLRHCCHR